MLSVRKIRHFLYVYNIPMMYGERENISRVYRFALPTRSNQHRMQFCAQITDFSTYLSWHVTHCLTTCCLWLNSADCLNAGVFHCVQHAQHAYLHSNRSNQVMKCIVLVELIHEPPPEETDL